MRRYINQDNDQNDLIHLAKENRHNQTESEKKLWRSLRDSRFSGYKFRRQHQLSRYIVDFICLEHKLIIELDGGQHGLPEGVLADLRRTEELGRLGFTVIRFWNHEVLTDEETVLRRIYFALGGKEYER